MPESVDTREHDLPGCRRRHGDEGPAAGTPCLDSCACRCHVTPHAFDPDADYVTMCHICERPPSDPVHVTPAVCRWPSDDDLDADCYEPAGPQVAMSPTVAGETPRIVPVCHLHAGRALGAGWFVHTPRAAYSGPWNPAWDGPRSIPDPLPPLFPPGQEPKGLIAPAIIFVLVGAAAALVLAGEVWDATARRRAQRRLLRALAKHRACPGWPS